MLMTFVRELGLHLRLRFFFFFGLWRDMVIVPTGNTTEAVVIQIL